MVNLLLPITEKPQLDSTINVDKIPLASCDQLIEKMFAIDQQYRDSLHHYNNDNAKQHQFTHLMMINDPVNQTIFLKILKRYGWPCRNDKGKLAFKAWIIAWHARSDYDKLVSFYPYLVDAYKHKCVNLPLFTEIKERIALMKTVRGR